ncbi:MAG: lambda exonuclease family protein, partial [Devosia sp.]
ADLTARTKTGYSASRATYLGQLVSERLTGIPYEGFTSTAMQWGLDLEAEAVAAYSFSADVDVLRGWFVKHPAINLTGATPDGLVGVDGLVEIKCPNTATHIETVLTGAIPIKYHQQMHWQMACSGRAWCDFVSYDPRMPEPLRLFVLRVQRDDEQIAELEREVREFLFELDRIVGRLTSIGAAA